MLGVCGQMANREWGREIKDRRRYTADADFAGSEVEVASGKCEYLTRVASPIADQVSGYPIGLTCMVLTGLR